MRCWVCPATRSRHERVAGIGERGRHLPRLCGPRFVAGHRVPRASTAGASFSRPHTSNDNPCSESLFKTTKYAPGFPHVFTGIDQGRDVIAPFFEHYNHHHRHTGIGLMTPAAVHRGDAPRITAARAITLNNAFERNPLRFKGRVPQPPRVPDKVYINPPRPTETAVDPSPNTDPH